MTTMQNMIQKARRRTFIDRTLHRSGYGLLVGSGLGLALLTYDRFTASEMSSLIFVIPAALGLIVGILLALRQIPDPMIAAILIDRQMRLQDQFGSAESLLRADSSTENRSGPHYDPEFAELVRREADRLASRIDVRTATPIQVTPIWGGSLALALALWMGVLFIPSRQAKAEPGVAEKTPEQMEEVRQQRQELAATIDETIEQLQDESILDERTREELAALNELADQLSSSSADDLDVEHVRDESAARLNEIADRLAEQSRRDLAARDQVANKFAGLDTPEPPPAAEPFTEAIKRGDFAEAADQLDELTRRSETMTDEQRELVANHLRDLGQQLETSGEVDQLMTEERKGQLEDALRDQG
ncbi:MAG: hypothetical protein O7G85_01945, partial [Planctomycetota bacterium]|nr:hypothetical protein [Planctomycetota bacterium]